MSNNQGFSRLPPKFIRGWSKKWKMGRVLFLRKSWREFSSTWWGNFTKCLQLSTKPKCYLSGFDIYVRTACCHERGFSETRSFTYVAPQYLIAWYPPSYYFVRTSKNTLPAAEPWEVTRHFFCGSAHALNIIRENVIFALLASMVTGSRYATKVVV